MAAGQPWPNYKRSYQSCFSDVNGFCCTIPKYKVNLEYRRASFPICRTFFAFYLYQLCKYWKVDLTGNFANQRTLSALNARTDISFGRCCPLPLAFPCTFLLLFFLFTRIMICWYVLTVAIISTRRSLGVGRKDSSFRGRFSCGTATAAIASDLLAVGWRIRFSPLLLVTVSLLCWKEEAWHRHTHHTIYFVFLVY